MEHTNWPSPLLKHILKNDSMDVETLCMISASHYLLGNQAMSASFLQKAAALRKPYQYGLVDYYVAIAHSISGQHEAALESLRASIAQGQRMGYHGFHNDYWLLPITDDPGFEDILGYWK